MDSRLGRTIGAVAAAAALLLAGHLPGAASAVSADDPGFELQWGLQQVGAPQAWATAAGDGMVIAVVDSGADLGHEDFRRPDGQTRIVGSVSCLGSRGDPSRCSGSAQDDDGHGTHVAGIAAATTGNGKGVAGTAPGAKLMIVRALKRTCSVPAVPSTCSAAGAASDVEAGIRWAADRGATVINLSLGDTTQSVLGPAFAEALRYAWSKGSIPVVAAGNDFVLSSGFSDEPAVVVAATARDRGPASYSNGVGAARWAVAAPGGEGERSPEQPCGADGPPEGILSTFFDPGNAEVTYACQAGTSMAAPHVAGALAILRSAGLTPQEAVDRLLATATDAGAPGRDASFGAGIVNIAKAVEGLRPAGGGTGPAPTTAPGTTPPTEVTGVTVPAAPAVTVPPASAGEPAPAPDETTSTTAGPEPETTTSAPPATLELAVDDPPAGGEPGPLLVGTAAGAALAAGAANAFWWRRLRGAPSPIA